MTTTANGLDELTALAGADLGHTGWLEITQQRVDMFADATGDHQWIHVDAGARRGRAVRRHDRARVPDPVAGHPAVR